jgi:hypothetical protein
MNKLILAGVLALVATGAQAQYHGHRVELEHSQRPGPHHKQRHLRAAACRHESEQHTA